jgi:hypothetical protein
LILTLREARARVGAALGFVGGPPRGEAFAFLLAGNPLSPRGAPPTRALGLVPRLILKEACLGAKLLLFYGLEFAFAAMARL